MFIKKENVRNYLNRNYVFVLSLIFYSLILKLNLFFTINNYETSYSLKLYFSEHLKNDSYILMLLLYFYKFFLIILPSFFIKKFDFNFFKIIIFGLYILFYIPLISFFTPINWLGLEFFIHKESFNESIFAEKRFYITIFYLCLTFCALFFIENKKLNIKTYKIRLRYDIFLKIFFLINSIFLIYFTFFFLKNFQDFINNLSLRNLLTGLNGYIISWFTIIFLPILYYLLHKRITKFFIIFLYLLIFVVLKAKIFLLITLLLIFSSTKFYRNLIENKNSLKLGFMIILIYQIIRALVEIYWYVFEIGYIDYLYFNRFFFEQAKNFLIFFNFFSTNEYLYLTHVNYLNKFPLIYDYSNDYSANILQHIQSIFRGGTPTPNLITLEGYSSFGNYGFLFIFFVLSFLGTFLKLYTDDKNHFLQLTLLIQSLYIIDVPFFTTCLTYGLLISCFLCFLKLEKSNDK